MKTDEASSTALTVAQGTLYCASQPDTASMVSKEIVDALHKILSCSREGKKVLGQLESGIFKRLLPLAEKLMMPGISLHYILRKSYIEHYVHECISQGTTQVVNLGAGFDTLCYRLSKQYEHVNFIEIDHPATSRLKVDALKDEASIGRNLTLIPVDFTQQTLEGSLASHEMFFEDRPTLFISEGVLVYLTEEQVRHQLDVLKQMCDHPPGFIFTYSEPDALKKQNGILLPLYLLIKGEPFNWSIMTKDLSDFLASNGYELISAKSPLDFKSDYVPDDYQGVIHFGENIAITKATA